jgi:hypothetical protein
MVFLQYCKILTQTVHVQVKRVMSHAKSNVGIVKIAQRDIASFIRAESIAGLFSVEKARENLKQLQKYNVDTTLESSALEEAVSKKDEQFWTGVLLSDVTHAKLRAGQTLQIIETNQYNSLLVMIRSDQGIWVPTAYVLQSVRFICLDANRTS